MGRLKKDTKDFYNLEVGWQECVVFLKIPERTFYKMVKDGILPKRADGVYVLGEVAEAYFKNKFGGDGIRAAKLRYELANAELKEIDLAERKGELVKISDVNKQVGDNILNAKNKLLAMPGKIAPEITGMNDTRAIEGILKREIYAALTELAEYDAGRKK